MLRLVLLGPPGCGKGTQAAKASAEYGLARISTGDILREEVNSRSALGLRVKGLMGEGKLVPDEVVLEVVRKKLGGLSASAGFILDGFPRTVAQAEALDLLLGQQHAVLDAVIAIEAADDAIVERLSLRRSCPRCGAVYNLVSAPPGKEGICDSCGEVLVRRADDREETVRERLKIYRRETEPLKEYYSRAGLLHEVKGEGTVEEVYEKVRPIIAGLF